MFKIVKTTLGAIALVVLIFGPYILFDKPFMAKYNCDMASFHPDIPMVVKEQCRKAQQ
jgi:hypothetical protein